MTDAPGTGADESRGEGADESARAGEGPDEAARAAVRAAKAAAKAERRAGWDVHVLMVEVGRKPGDGLPDGAVGAVLLCYSAAENEAAAVDGAVKVLQDAGMAPLEVTAYGSRDAAAAAGEPFAEEEVRLMDRAQAEDAVIVADFRVIQAGEDRDGAA